MAKLYIIGAENDTEEVLYEQHVARGKCDQLNAGRQPESEGPYEVTELEVESFAAALGRVEAAKQKVDEAILVALAVGCRRLFDDHPDLHSISWSQYFHLSEDGNAVEDYHVVHSDEISDEVTELLGTFSDNDLFDLFGSEVTVTVHRDGSLETKGES